MPWTLSSTFLHSHGPAPHPLHSSQRAAFMAYWPSHINGAAFIILVSSVNAVCYNLVRGRRGRKGHDAACAGWHLGPPQVFRCVPLARAIIS